MVKKELMIIADYSRQTILTLEEVCESCQISTDYIHDLIEYDIIHLENEALEEQYFNLKQLQRIQTAIRLQQDLEVNLAGIAIILDLLDEMEDMRARMELLERLYF